MKTETLEFSTATGDTTAYVAMPAKIGDETKAILVIQEYWGLNDHIKDIANRYAGEGYIAIAPDLYHGTVATDKQEASKLMENLGIEDGLDTINNAMLAAQEKYGVIKFGITGFCMGGTYALEAACKLEGIRAAAPFYGDIPEESVLTNLKCPVLFVSGTKDQWINTEKVAELERIAKTNLLPINVLKYEADHAFFNDTRPEVYDAKAAKDAWGKVLSFLNEELTKNPAEKLS